MIVIRSTGMKVFKYERDMGYSIS